MNGLTRFGIGFTVTFVALQIIKLEPSETRLLGLLMAAGILGAIIGSLLVLEGIV